jgi:hypothetical protein
MAEIIPRQCGTLQCGRFFQIDAVTDVTGPGNIIVDFIMEAGKTVTLTVLPNFPGIRLRFGSLRVVRAVGGTAEFLLSSFGGEANNEYTFTMPSYDVRVCAEFEAE